uniref:Uncharacterized protein n=1 Tax=Lepeophtheirus salmonis TaxID=72036 RepID=A0A0K2TEW8_LEPSM
MEEYHTDILILDASNVHEIELQDSVKEEESLKATLNSVRSNKWSNVTEKFQGPVSRSDGLKGQSQGLTVLRTDKTVPKTGLDRINKDRYNTKSQNLYYFFNNRQFYFRGSKI